MKYQHFKMRNNCSITVKFGELVELKLQLKYECLVQNGMHCKKRTTAQLFMIICDMCYHHLYACHVIPARSQRTVF